MNRRRVVAANCPAHSEPSVLSNVALSVTVPVVVSTALSMKLSVPFVGAAATMVGGGSLGGSWWAPPAGDPAGVSCAGASTGAPVEESPNDALGAAPPGTAVTGRPPRAPYCRMSGSCDAGTAKRDRKRGVEG